MARNYTDPDRQRELTKLRVRKFRAKQKANFIITSDGNITKEEGDAYIG